VASTIDVSLALLVGTSILYVGVSGMSVVLLLVMVASRRLVSLSLIVEGWALGYIQRV